MQKNGRLLSYWVYRVQFHISQALNLKTESFKNTKQKPFFGQTENTICTRVPFSKKLRNTFTYRLVFLDKLTRKKSHHILHISLFLFHYVCAVDTSGPLTGSHSFNSFAILLAMFLKPMLVPGTITKTSLLHLKMLSNGQKIKANISSKFTTFIWDVIYFITLCFNSCFKCFLQSLSN